MQSSIENFDKRKLIANFILNDALEKNFDACNNGRQRRVDNSTVVVSNLKQYPLQINIILDGHGGDFVSDWVNKNIQRIVNQVFDQEFREDNPDHCQAQHNGTNKSQEDRAKLLYCESFLNNLFKEELEDKISRIIESIVSDLAHNPNINHTGSCISIAISQFDDVKNEIIGVVGHLGDSSHTLLIKGLEESDDKVLNVNGFENLHVVHNLIKNPEHQNTKEFIKNKGRLNKYNKRFNDNLMVYKALGDKNDMQTYQNNFGYIISINSFLIEHAISKEIYLAGVSDGVNLDNKDTLLHVDQISNNHSVLRNPNIDLATKIINPIRNTISNDNTNQRFFDHDMDDINEFNDFDDKDTPNQDSYGDLMQQDNSFGLSM